MPFKVTPSYCINLDGFDDLMIYGNSIRRFLKIIGCENALCIEENVYPNIVKVFYSKMLISATR